MDKKFIVKFSIFVVLLGFITGGAIYFTIESLEEENKETSSIQNTVIDQEVKKKVAEDSKYGIQSYLETYNINSLNITNYYDIDGKVTDDVEKKYENYNAKSIIEYIQIDGLKEKEIEEKINERLKQEAYKLENQYVSVTITANFANVLSLYLDGYGDRGEDITTTLNIDLTTGEDIPLEKVFVSSAPIHSFLTEGLYETLAWENAWDEENEGTYDMDKADTSEYEDKAWLLVNKYKKNKENLQYVINPSSITIYNFVDESITGFEGERSIEIDFLKHYQDIAIFKRYLTNTSIYEDNSIGTKDIIIMTKDLNNSGYTEYLSYGKIEDNIFIEELMLAMTDEKLTENKTLKATLEKISKEQQQKLKNQLSRDKGMFFQREYWLSEEDDKYVVGVTSYQAMCDREYFEEEAFGDYIKSKAYPTVELSLNGFSEYMSEEFPNLKISNSTYERIYISKTGQILDIIEENQEEEVVDEVSEFENEQDIQKEFIQEEGSQENFEEEIEENRIEKTNENVIQDMNEVVNE